MASDEVLSQIAVETRVVNVVSNKYWSMLLRISFYKRAMAYVIGSILSRSNYDSRAICKPHAIGLHLQSATSIQRAKGAGSLAVWAKTGGRYC